MSVRYIRRGENFNENVLNRPVEDAIEKINEDLPSREEIGQQADAIAKGNFVYSFRELDSNDYIEFANQYISRSDSRVISLLEDFHENRFWQPDLPIVGDASHNKTESIIGGTFPTLSGEVVYDVKFSASKAMIVVPTSHRLLVFNTADLFEGNTPTPVYEVAFNDTSTSRIKNATWGRTDSYILFSEGDDFKSLDMYTGDVYDLNTTSSILQNGGGCLDITQCPEDPSAILHVRVGSSRAVRGFREKTSIREFSGSFVTGEEWDVLSTVGFTSPFSGTGSFQQPLCFKFWQSNYPILYSVLFDTDNSNYRLRASRQENFAGFDNLFESDPFSFSNESDTDDTIPRMFLLGDKSKSEPAIVAAFNGQVVAFLDGTDGSLISQKPCRWVSQVNESTLLITENPSLLVGGVIESEITAYSAGSEYTTLVLQDDEPNFNVDQTKKSIMTIPYDNNMVLQVYSHPTGELNFKWAGKFDYDFSQQFYFRKPDNVKGDLKQYVRAR